MKKEVLTPEDLAERWNMEVATLKVWRNRKMGPKFIKLTHKKVLYRLIDILEFEEKNLVDIGA